MKAVRAVEEMKDAEIAALKAQLKVAASSSPPSQVSEQNSNLESLSRDELISIVRSYQQMMPQYTVGKGQTSTVVPPPANDARGLYQKRNERLVASASAGKSRWGSMEIDRAIFLTERANGQKVVTGTQSAGKVNAASAGLHDKYQMRNARLVAAASAGKTRWGEMEVLRVQKLQGTSVVVPDHPSTNHSPQPTSSDDKFQMRNARVLAAANAGKSRWGELEVQKLQNLGAGSAFANGAASTVSIKPPVMAESSMNSKFQLRNARVVASASAGKSRWGEMEIAKAQSLIGGSVKATDHPVANGASHPSESKPAPITSDTSMNSKFQLRNARLVAAASAGKSRWGEMEIAKAQSLVGGSVKAVDHPVANGASHTSTTTPGPVTSVASMNSSFQLRNARVAAAASAGKSRWGDMEVNRIQNSYSLNLGDQPVANGASNTVSTPPPQMAGDASLNPYFELRNARVAASAAAGKSRWGEMELQRMQNSGSVASVVATSHANGSPQPAGANGKFQMRNARLVAAASAGKSRWGELEVLKAQKSSNGSLGYTQNGSTNGMNKFTVNSNFQLRNARLVQAARAGKTRWGEMEVLRAERST